ncbi:HNH endonuclease signature motif containing protein [Knoellia subterranea]|uniref:HNH nuclease n=1 Tax=Knoellia subterranea KCTC 19937 TaxID=1385521 RepID=A0A0A0JGQ9_9MICO|nr:HNH endonuclease signature motif containing protein [Knoellia subterranea]KGN36333.1 HNH nuclease [Knoellia subterranea KCTC 19937]
MSESAAPLAHLREVLTAAHDGLAGVGSALSSLSSGDLAELMTLVDGVRAQTEAAQVRVVAEGAHRGDFTAAMRGEGTAHGWVRMHAPSLRQGGAGQLAQFAQLVAAATPSGEWVNGAPRAGSFADEEQPEGKVWKRVAAGEVGVSLALTTLREIERMKDLLKPEAIPTVTDGILDVGQFWGQGEARKLRPRLLAKHGLEGAFDKKQKKLAPGAFLTSPIVEEAELTEYRMAMTPEQAARLEAAIGPLSKPAPNPDTGEADLRSAGQRRVEALTAVLAGRAGEDADHAEPGGAPTVVHVSMTLAELLAGLSQGDGHGSGAGRVMGSRAQQTMLAPSTVRQMACDADVVPVVLGADGEVVDLGRVTRLFTRGQRRWLWHRDGGCTFPGCTAPAAWTQAHHLVHWVDGGASDLTNAALLCQRHHTQVHQQRLIATVHPPDADGRSVTWDLGPDSYDRELPERLAEFARAKRDAAERRRRRRKLDTGLPEGWGSAMSEEDLLELGDELLAEHELFEDAFDPDEHDAWATWGAHDDLWAQPA